MNSRFSISVIAIITSLTISGAANAYLCERDASVYITPPSGATVERKASGCQTDNYICARYGYSGGNTGSIYCTNSCAECLSGKKKVAIQVAVGICDIVTNSCIGCTSSSDCTSMNTDWYQSSNTHQRYRQTGSCTSSQSLHGYIVSDYFDSTGICYQTTQRQCIGGYYGNPTSDTYQCAKCDTPGTSTAGSNYYKTNCYIPKGTTFTETTGSGSYHNNCNHNGQ